MFETDSSSTPTKSISGLAITGIIILIIAITLIIKTISFNNTMTDLSVRIDNETESTKVNYSQCLTKIAEVNDVAKGYTKDVKSITEQTGKNLGAFENQMMTWLNSKIMPELSPSLRENVQIEIVTCRNSYYGKVDLDLKPLYTTYNTNLRTFPNSLINMFTGFEKKDFVIPKIDEVTKAFETGVDKKLDLE